MLDILISIHKKGLTAHDEFFCGFELDTAPVVEERGGGGLAGLREAIARLLAVSKVSVVLILSSIP